LYFCIGRRGYSWLPLDSSWEVKVGKEPLSEDWQLQGNEKKQHGNEPKAKYV